LTDAFGTFVAEGHQRTGACEGVLTVIYRPDPLLLAEPTPAVHATSLSCKPQEVCSEKTLLKRSVL
jgi:hypothetical protein